LQAANFAGRKLYGCASAPSAGEIQVVPHPIQLALSFSRTGCLHPAGVEAEMRELLAALSQEACVTAPASGLRSFPYQQSGGRGEDGKSFPAGVTRRGGLS